MNGKKFAVITVASIVIAVLCMFYTGPITGKVVDMNSKPLSDVLVVCEWRGTLYGGLDTNGILFAKEGVFTDKGGNFKISPRLLFRFPTALVERIEVYAVKPKYAVEGGSIKYTFMKPTADEAKTNDGSVSGSLWLLDSWKTTKRTVMLEGLKDAVIRDIPHDRKHESPKWSSYFRYYYDYYMLKRNDKSYDFMSDYIYFKEARPLVKSDILQYYIEDMCTYLHMLNKGVSAI